MKKFFPVLFIALLSLGACCNKKDSTCKKETECKKEACTSKKIVVVATVEIKEDKVQDFLQAVPSILSDSRAEEGCISYTLYQKPDNHSQFFFFEEWKDQAAIDFHFETAHFKDFGEKLNDLAVAPPNIKVMEVVSEK